jgi:hypothetical protein
LCVISTVTVDKIDNIYSIQSKLKNHTQVCPSLCTYDMVYFIHSNLRNPTQLCPHVISLFLLFNVTSLIFIIIKRIIPCSSVYGITVLYRSHTTMYNYEENKRSTRRFCVYSWKPLISIYIVLLKICVRFIWNNL